MPANSAARTVVIVPNWNGAPLLAQYLPGVLAQGAPVVVVDNGSTDDSAAIARGLGAQVMALPRNVGFAGAVNHGLASTDAPLVAIVNNDVRLAPNWLQALAAALDTEAAHLASGRIWNERTPPRIDGTYDLLCAGATAWRAGAGGAGNGFTTRRPVPLVPLTAALLRREAFVQAGPLDEDFESYLEDVEFGLRCARLGLGAVYEPAAEAWHRGSATLGAWHPETTRRIARNQLMLVAKHYPPDWLPRYGWRVLAAQALWGLVAARHGAALAYLRGKGQGLKGFRAWRDASKWAHREDHFDAILHASEAELARLQSQSPGSGDAYWRWYFRLAGRRA
jgi:GT2 family glycosyltransferase